MAILGQGVYKLRVCALTHASVNASYWGIMLIV